MNRYGRWFPFILAVPLLFLLATHAGAAVRNEECLDCHDKLKGVSHGGASCIDCHSTITELPHPDKLPKPACATCHDKVAASYAADVHKAKGLACSRCHNAHNPQKDKKGCSSCHGQVTHSKLPAKERHLGNLGCIACHGKPDKTQLAVQVTIKGKQTPGASTIDGNGNGVVDNAEWQRFVKVLQGSLKGNSTTQKNYRATGGFHTITPKPAECARCHAAGGYFNDASLRVTNSKSFELRMDPHIFIRNLPSQNEFSRTVHGASGVTCADCHGAEKKTAQGWSTDSSVCAKCHQDVSQAYGLSEHAKMGAAQCIDCHNPHRVRSYKELRAEERIAVCARCHGNYVERHSWLPNTALHFNYLECATCHSPRSQKSIVYYFAQKTAGGKVPLTYDRVEALSGRDPSSLVQRQQPGSEGNDAKIGALFTSMRQRDKNVVIDASIIVTKAFHDYSETRIRERECITCHSRQARFYDSMFFIIPGKESAHHIPMKGTLFSSYPIGTAVDFFLLGEDKLTKGDFAAFLGMGGDAQPPRPLGFKLIDLFGMLVMLLAFVAVGIHAILRVLVKR